MTFQEWVEQTQAQKANILGEFRNEYFDEARVKIKSGEVKYEN